MVKTAYINYGERIGAVVWDEAQEVSFFEYDKNYTQKRFLNKLIRDAILISH